MNVVTRSARRATRNVFGNGSLNEFKANAHRANRARINRTLTAIVNGAINADDADFMPLRTHMVTAYDIT